MVAPSRSQSTFPALPLLAATLVLLALSQLGWWGWQHMQRNNARLAVLEQSNLFTALVMMQQRHAAARTIAELRPKRLPEPDFAPMMRAGAGNAPHTLTLMADPSRAADRQLYTQLRQLVRANALAKLELHVLPQPGTGPAAGLALALANREGKLPMLEADIWGARADLNDDELLKALTNLGLQPRTIRAALDGTDPGPLGRLQPALSWAKFYGVTSPAVMLDGFLIDGEVLHMEMLETYITRRNRGEALIQTDDFLLMRK